MQYFALIVALLALVMALGAYAQAATLKKEVDELKKSAGKENQA